MGLLIVIVGVCGLYRREGDPVLFPPAVGEGVQIYVLDNGFHTDLVLPRVPLEASGGPVAAAVRQLPAGDWIYVGWGDATFYVEEGPIAARWRDGLRALFGRDNPSVVRLSSGAAPTDRFVSPDVQDLSLSPLGLSGMIQRLDQSMMTGPDGQPVLFETRARDGSYFWRGTEVFWLGHLCNHWTIQLMSEAGVTVWPWRLMTSGEVMRTAKRAETRAAALDLQRQRD